jgi:branched-chain amino acid transport system permease protein
MTAPIIIQFLVNGFMVGGVYALIALSIVLVYKSTRVFNFAVGQIIMFCGFVCWALIEQAGLPVWLGLLFGLAGGLLVGVIIERLTLRPLIGQPILASIMITLALAYFLNGLTLFIWQAYGRNFPQFLPGKPLQLIGIMLSHEHLWTFGIAIFVFIIFAMFYRYSGTGLDMRAAAEDHQLAQSRGVRVRKIFSVTWAIVGLIATVSGVLLGVRLGLSLSLPAICLKAFPAVLFGGLESIPGAIIGGLTVGILENLVGGLVHPQLMEITPYIILLIILIIRPEGLFGLKRIERI